ncbi:AraC-like DNA-binding protein/quercetin dioxygenase-like cupin family protein [Lactobacillus colini]|uniref:AraC-like DNA-binding protein/quercetin dioxygenase-like cupin family protein n=1 Tax=Lactobacillus colini TaxID=1819254 RepID=A0ABS4MBT7_9LACO|nr:AraC family transcriptional regulator [Lactobacillus colini]MBP2057145.1 AraC-like DNA-binding protein/quercetin dioxygenase-like cupin family protein [Lactobacillus colini]
MNKEILDLLRQNSRQQNWEEINKKLNPITVGHVNGEMIYQFFETLYDQSFKENKQMISITTQSINSYIPYHIHNYVVITVVLAGQCIFHTPNETLKVNQDDVLIIGSHTIYKIDEIPEDTILINISLKRAAFSLYDFDFLTHNQEPQSVPSLIFSTLSNENIHGAFNLFRTHHDTQVITIINDIIKEYFDHKSYSNQLIHLKLLELLVRLIRITSETRDLQIQRNNQKVGEIDTLSLALYIEKNYKDISLAKMAKHFGFNPDYLSALLKKKTGYSFVKLVQLQRVNIAAEYLSFTNMSIETIANEVGYKGTPYFYRFFKKYMGISPQQYRNYIGKGDN